MRQIAIVLVILVVGTIGALACETNHSSTVVWTEPGDVTVIADPATGVLSLDGLDIAELEPLQLDILDRLRVINGLEDLTVLLDSEPAQTEMSPQVAVTVARALAKAFVKGITALIGHVV